MTKRRTHQRIPRTPAARARHDAIRRRFQAERPSLETPLQTGDAEAVTTLGEYQDILEMVRALKQARQDRRLTLTQVAQRAGIDKAAVSRLENGLQVNPTITTLSRYAAAVGVRVSWVLRRGPVALTSAPKR